MASSLSFSSWLLFVSLIVIFFFFTNPAMSDGGTTDIIEKVCRQNEDYGFCRAVYYQNLDPSRTSLTDLTRFTMVQTLSNATMTLRFIQDLIDNTADQTLKSHLEICHNSYAIVQSSFANALLAFFKGDYKGMLQYEEKAPKEEGICAGNFAPPSPPSPMNERNREVRILTTMSVVTGLILSGVQS